MSRFLLPLLLLLTGLLLVPTAALAADVAVLDDAVEPDPVTVPTGEAVVLTNEGEDEVRLVDDAGRWDSGPLAPGESFRITFDEPGTVTFTAEDDSLTGTIEVTQGPATEDPATEDPATEDPATEDPATEEPATEDPATEDPATEAPASEEPVGELAVGGAPSDLLAMAMVGSLVLGALVLRRGRQA